jgi:NitT/TauT family transport system permease protein
LSSPALETPAPDAGPEEGRPAPRRAAGPGDVSAATAVAAPAAAALAALALHLLLPDRQKRLPLTWMDPLPAWQHPYPVLLTILLAALPLLAALEWLAGYVWRRAGRRAGRSWEGLRPALQGWWQNVFLRPRLRIVLLPLPLLAAALLRVLWDLRPWRRYNAPLTAGALALVALWDCLTLKDDWLSGTFFPGPDMVLGGMIEDRGILLESTWHSLRLLAAGYAVGVTAGLVCGVLIGWYARVRYWGVPVLRVFGPVPATAMIPLAMTLSNDPLLCGAGLIGFAVWFPVTMLTYSGIANVRLSHLDVARTLGAGRLYLIFRVAVPSALPSIFLGLFMALGASFLTLIVAETVGVKAGLGWYLLWRKGYGEYAQVYAALLIMAVFFSTIMTLLFRVRDWVLRWQKGVLKW